METNVVVRVLKRTIVAVSCLVFVAICASPISAKTHDYSLRVQVIRTRWHGRHGWFSGFGHANLISQQAGHPPKQGMDFEFGCTNPVRHTFAPDTYPARYGKNQYEVVVLLPELGTDKGKECSLKIEMMDFIYRGGPNGALYSVPLNGGPPTPVQEGNDGDQ
jgi:hypothetical protein